MVCVASEAPGSAACGCMQRIWRGGTAEDTGCGTIEMRRSVEQPLLQSSTGGRCIRSIYRRKKPVQEKCGRQEHRGGLLCVRDAGWRMYGLLSWWAAAAFDAGLGARLLCARASSQHADRRGIPWDSRHEEQARWAAGWLCDGPCGALRSGHRRPCLPLYIQSTIMSRAGGVEPQGMYVRRDEHLPAPQRGTVACRAGTQLESRGAARVGGLGQLDTLSAECALSCSAGSAMS